MRMTSMKRASTVIGTVALLGGLTACTTTANIAGVSGEQKEKMLSRAGFIAKSVATPKQQQQVKQLPDGVVSAVKCQGKLRYVYATEGKDRIFFGKQAQYEAYKKMLAAQAAKADAAEQSQTNGETAGPHRIIVQEFDGFGPLPDNPAWQ